MAIITNRGIKINLLTCIKYEYVTHMKKLIISAIAMTLMSCATVPPAPATTSIAESKTDTIPEFVIQGLKLQQDLGKLQRREYQGVLPCADCPGIEYTVTLWNQQFCGDGVYFSIMKYVDKNVEDTMQGNWFTLRGDAVNINATVYQLSPDNEQNCVNLLYLKDSLVMLDAEFRRVDSPFSSTLKLLNQIDYGTKPNRDTL